MFNREVDQNSTRLNGIVDTEDAFSNRNDSAEGFVEQDLFASNKAKDAFGEGDPFGSAFPVEGANVRLVRN